MSVRVAIIGPGNIGTDLLIKIKRFAGDELEPVALVGIDPTPDGSARARRLGIDAIGTGVQGLIEHPRFDEIDIVFAAGPLLEDCSVPGRTGREAPWAFQRAGTSRCFVVTGQRSMRSAARLLNSSL